MIFELVPSHKVAVGDSHIAQDNRPTLGVDAQASAQPGQLPLQPFLKIGPSPAQGLLRGGGYGPGMTSDTGLELGRQLSFDYALVPHAGDWRQEYELD